MGRNDHVNPNCVTVDQTADDLITSISPIHPSSTESASQPPRSPLPPTRFVHTRSRLHALHTRIPLLHHLPPRSVFVIALLIVVNLIVWAICAIPLRLHPALLSPALLAYTLGLRHALDADHISAIDLITRRLVSSTRFNAENAPVTVGTWFSLGHSTVVVVTAIVVAATASEVQKKWEGWEHIGGIVGSSVSAVVLVGFGVVNAWMLVGCVRRLREKVATVQADGEVRKRRGEVEEVDLEGGKNGDERENQQRAVLDNAEKDKFHIHGGGCLIFLFQKLFRLIDRPWKTYPLGILFGLGFDTSSEIALLAISSIQAAKGTSLWLILVFPVLFTAGMCLLDTTDGALMMALYTSASKAGKDGKDQSDELAPLYYNTVLTTTTVIVALVIGTFQVLGMASAILGDRASGGAWDGINAIGDHYGAIGGGICALFVVAGLGSVLCYKPWRRWLLRRARQRRQLQVEEDGDFEMLAEAATEAKVDKHDLHDKPGFDMINEIEHDVVAGTLKNIDMAIE